MLILVTNDDGIQADGIKALAEALKELGEVVVVAPAVEQSGSSHAITMHSPLLPREEAPGWWSVNGTPSDCVYVGIHSVLKRKPDLLVSGINRGPNLGDDVTYSGTVAAAMEGAMQGVPSLAVSLNSYHPESYLYAARVALHVARRLEDFKLPPRTLLNLNVPAEATNGSTEIRVTRQGRRNYSQNVVERLDPRGRKYVWLGGDPHGHEYVDGGDIEAVSEGCISLTPLQLDLTAYELMENLKRLEGRID